jgi:hypothetical protein
MGQSFTLIDPADSTTTGTFAGLPEGAVFGADGMAFQITYKGGTFSNQVLVTRVAPPPSSLVVDNTGDGDGDSSVGHVTLREAIELANVLPDHNTITFDHTTFGTPQTITLGGTQLPALSGDVTITGPGAKLLTIDAGRHSGIFVVNSGVTVALSGLALVHGQSEQGGGIDNEGTLTVTACTFSGGSASDGGGLYNNGTATVTDCAFSGNLGLGGAIHNAGGSLTVDTSTFSGNHGGPASGALYNAASAQLTDCTISLNDAPVQGGGIYNAGSLTLTNTIVAGNTRTGGGTSDIEGTAVTDGGFNLIGDSATAGGLTDGTNHDLVGHDPKLGALADNGGPTPTMALLFGSPAIDAGGPAGAGGTDQRGMPRPFDIPGIANASDGRDIGAFEVSSLFTDSFGGANGSPLGANWTSASGKFLIENGMAFTKGGPSLALSKGVSVADATVEADVSLTAHSDSRAGLVARYTAAGPHQDESYYWARLIRSGKRVLAQVWRFEHGTWTQVGHSAVVSSSSAHLRFEVSGNSLKLFVDGNLAVSGSDGKLAGPGTVGMRALAASLGSFQVTPL